MKHIVFYSGGIGSFLSAKRVVEKHGPSDVILLFTDTKTEHKDLYRFIDETVEYLGAELVTLADGRDVWQVFKDVKLMGNSRMDPCSRILKRELSNKWVRENFTPENSILYFGIDWQESHRMKSIVKNWDPWKVEAPMTEPPYILPAQKFQILEECGIEKPYLYKIGMSHNNCAGFCVKAGQAHYKNLYSADPELYKQHETREQDVYDHLGKTNPFLKMQVNGETEYFTLRRYREEYLDTGKNFELFDFSDGCGCFLGDDQA